MASNTESADPKLAAIREQMAKANDGAGVDAYIVPSEDPHMSEYAPECQARREYLSAFTGSAGTVVVTATHACLWTDGRYYLQGSQQLGPEWTLMKHGTKDCPEIQDWLAETLPAGGRVGIDPFLHTIKNATTLRTTLEDAGRSLTPVHGGNLVDAIWEGRPEMPTAAVRVHALEHAGQSVSDKVAALRQKMEAKKAGVLLVTPLDEVAWLFNMRGADVEFNPVFIAYGMVTSSAVRLYVDAAKIGQEAAAHLSAEGVEVRPYEAFTEDVAAAATAGESIWMDPAQVSYAVYSAADSVTNGNAASGKRKASGDGSASSGRVMQASTPVALAKAIKNDAERAGMVEAHLRDAVAIVQFLSWFEKEVAAGNRLTEVDVDKHLTGRRREQPGFIECSFPTIAGAGPNGAIIHYRAQQESCRTVDQDTLLLIDSGGQYDCGTTDITRTFHTGTPTDHQRTCWTKVLQGHIALDTAIFPEGTAGFFLDTLARAPLWTLGLNYRHGTGHGVGAALNVHEGPIGISFRTSATTPLEAGMIVSNEPGYYEDGAFGIRIENLMTIVKADTAFNFGDQPYYGFEPLTLVPMQKQMMDLSLMKPEEIAWVNAMHKNVWEKVSPRLSGDALEWLKVSCEPIAA